MQSYIFSLWQWQSTSTQPSVTCLYLGLVINPTGQYIWPFSCDMQIQQSTPLFMPVEQRLTIHFTKASPGMFSVRQVSSRVGMGRRAYNQLWTFQAGTNS
ncbi:hypothetical protein J0S82_000294 [Galemys pyrenaicus]|uniref:Uncharacterized protein n=1 Tax=Galemys pyrenaicus TaxID=202257 RepID=A0A8J6DVF7_GALPY|nr:hypothetical protein J0S82_000294 [Galemys pyrenaicus]